MAKIGLWNVAYVYAKLCKIYREVIETLTMGIMTPRLSAEQLGRVISKKHWKILFWHVCNFAKRMKFGFWNVKDVYSQSCKNPNTTDWRTGVIEVGNVVVSLAIGDYKAISLNSTLGIYGWYIVECIACWEKSFFLSTFFARFFVHWSDDLSFICYWHTFRI